MSFNPNKSVDPLVYQMAKVTASKVVYLFNEIYFQRSESQSWYILKTLMNLGYLEKSVISAAHKTHNG